MIKHSEEFKREAVRIALTSGLPRERVAYGREPRAQGGEGYPKKACPEPVEGATQFFASQRP